MKQEVNVVFKDGMSFEVNIDDYKFMIDADPEVGGNNKGPKPKPLMLAALGGCTAMDVVSILRKMRVEFDSFNVIVEGDTTEEHPKKYHTIKVIYELKGKNIPREKVEKAVSLSEERYCGVSAVYREALKMENEIRIIE